MLVPQTGGDFLASWGTPAGYDIFMTVGDSNMFFGSAYDGSLDVGDARIFQLGVNAPNANAVILANDPLDLPDTTGNPGYIGPTVHFVKDQYMANGLLLGSRNALIVCYDYGGSSAAVANGTNWGALTGTPGTPTTPANSLLDKQVGRRTTALGLSGTNTVVAVLDTEGSNAYTAFANTLQLAAMNKYRWQLHRKYQFIRNLVGATVPIVISRSSEYAIANGAGRYSTNGMIVDGIIRAMASKFPYLGVADATGLGTASVHFTAADQRLRDDLYYTAFLAAKANTTRTVTWDANDTLTTALGYAAGYVLSNGNLDITGDTNSAWKTHLATGPLRSGKAYCEVKVQAMASATNLGYLGFCNADKYLNVQLGTADANDGPADMSAGHWGIADNSVVGYTKSWAGTTTWVLNDIIMLAVDMTSGKAWIGKNGTWLNSGDPAAGTGNWLAGIVDPIYIAASIFTGTGNKWRLQATAASQTYSPPSGFSAWGQ